MVLLWHRCEILPFGIFIFKRVGVFFCCCCKKQLNVDFVHRFGMRETCWRWWAGSTGSPRSSNYWWSSLLSWRPWLPWTSLISGKILSQHTLMAIHNIINICELVAISYEFIQSYSYVCVWSAYAPLTVRFRVDLCVCVFPKNHISVWITSY